MKVRPIVSLSSSFGKFVNERYDKISTLMVGMFFGRHAVAKPRRGRFVINEVLRAGNYLLIKIIAEKPSPIEFATSVVILNERKGRATFVLDEIDDEIERRHVLVRTFTPSHTTLVVSEGRGREERAAVLFVHNRTGASLKVYEGEKAPLSVISRKGRDNTFLVSAIVEEGDVGRPTLINALIKVEDGKLEIVRKKKVDFVEALSLPLGHFLVSSAHHLDHDKPYHFIVALPNDSSPSSPTAYFLAFDWNGRKVFESRAIANVFMTKTHVVQARIKGEKAALMIFRSEPAPSSHFVTLRRSNEPRAPWVAPSSSSSHLVPLSAVILNDELEGVMLAHELTMSADGKEESEKWTLQWVVPFEEIYIEKTLKLGDTLKVISSVKPVIERVDEKSVALLLAETVKTTIKEDGGAPKVIQSRQIRRLIIERSGSSLNGRASKVGAISTALDREREVVGTPTCACLPYLGNMTCDCLPNRRFTIRGKYVNEVRKAPMGDLVVGRVAGVWAVLGVGERGYEPIEVEARNVWERGMVVDALPITDEYVFVVVRTPHGNIEKPLIAKIER